MMKKVIKGLAIFCAVMLTTGAMAENLFTTTISNDSGWLFWLDDTTTKAGSFGKIENGQAIVKSADIGTAQNPNRIQLMKPFKLNTDNKSYKLKFKVKADKAGTIEFSYGMLRAPFTIYGTTGTEIAAGEKNYEVTLKINNMDDGKKEVEQVLRIVFGAFKDANVTLSDISMEPLD